jgi:hypothetical protein
MPIRIEDGRVTMRAGTLRTVAFPLTNIARVRTQFGAEDLKRRGVVNLALIAYPNVLIELAMPIGQGRKQIVAVAHRLDEPTPFLAALASRNA